MISVAAAALTLAIVLVVLPPMTGPLERRFLRSNPSTARKLTYYGFTIATSLALTAIAVWTFGIERLLEAPWPGAAWLPFASIAGPLIGVLLVSGLAFVFLVRLMCQDLLIRGAVLLGVEEHQIAADSAFDADGEGQVDVGFFRRE